MGWAGLGWVGLVWSGLVCDDDNARSLHSRCGTGCAGQELDETMPLPWTGVCARGFQTSMINDISFENLWFLNLLSHLYIRHK